MNFNLASNSVGFYQISKLACIPVTLLLETALDRRQQILTFRMVISLVSIMIGMSLVAVNEIQFNYEGFIWASCGVICSSCAQIFFSPLQKQLNLDALQMLFHLSPFLTVGSFATIPLFENTTELLDFKIDKNVIVDIGISCFMAVLLNTSNYLGERRVVISINNHPCGLHEYYSNLFSIHIFWDCGSYLPSSPFYLFTTLFSNFLEITFFILFFTLF